MRKLFTLLIALALLAGSSWAQSVVIGTGTTNTNSSTLDPVERYYNYEHYQVIYTAAELLAAGLPSGATINALGFSISESAASLANYTISMGLTTQTIAQPYISTLTPVKNAFTYVPIVQAAGSFDMIPFDANFVWDGLSNIVINTCTGSNPFTTPYGGLRYTASTTGTITYIRTDGTTSNCATTTLASTTYRPNIQFNYTGGTACSGTPDPGNTISSANPACPAVSFALSLQNATTGSGVTYVWETSPDGQDPWTPAGATNATFTTSQTTVTWYRCQVTCSGNTGVSTPLEVTMNSLFNCYCPSGASSTSDEEITNVTFGSYLNNTSACASLIGTQGTATGTADLYSNFTSIAATDVSQGATAPIAVTITECAGSAYSHSVHVYIDFNQNGLLTDAGEDFTIWAYASSNTHTILADIAIPLDAVVGNTLMRVVCKESSVTGPCLVSSWGETEDYTINITQAIVGNLSGFVHQKSDCVDPARSVTVSNGFYTVAASDDDGFYEFTDIPVGTYNFTASAPDYTSETVSGIVVTEGNTTSQDFCIAKYYAPPAGLTATVSGVNLNNVNLAWLAPGAVPDQWIQWDDGVQFDAIGTGSAFVFSVASRWPVADIATYGGKYLTKISFYPYVAACTYTLKVWDDVNATNLRYSAVVSVTADTWNTVTIPGVLIDGAKELWFGYEANTTTGYPAGCDAGPAIVGYGDMMNDAGTWYSMYTAYALNYNWCIHGWVSTLAKGAQQAIPIVQNTQPKHVNAPGVMRSANSQNASLGQSISDKPAPGQKFIDEVAVQPTEIAPMAPLATVSGYNVYRNTVKISDNQAPLFYDDLARPKGGYDYQVSAKYSDGGESALIGPAHVDIYTCFPPTNIQIPASGTTMVAATATWTASTITTNPEWIVEYGPAGFAHGAGIGGAQYVTSATFTMSSLTAGTVYDFYVRTYCEEGDSSVWVKKTFQTHFFDCPDPSTPEVEICGDSTNDGCNITVPAFESLDCGETKCGKGYYNGDIRDTDWYEFVLDQTTDVTISGKAEFSYILGFIASPCPATAFIAYATGAPGATVSVTKQLAAGTYYVFASTPFVEHVKCDSLDHYYFTLSCNSCLAPTALTATGITATDAILGWTPVGSETAWEYVLGPTPVPVPTGAGLAATNPMPVGGLTGSTSYSYYVRADCGAGIYSTWAGPYTFATECVPIDLPYSQNFDLLTAPALPLCWTQDSSAAALSPWMTSSSIDIGAHSSPNFAVVYYSTTGPKNEWLVSPAITVAANRTYQVKFWVQAPGWLGVPESLKLVASSDSSITGLIAGEVLWDNPSMEIETYTEMTAYFTPTTAGPYYFAWHAYSIVDVDYIALDDVSIELVPLPVDLTVSGAVVSPEDNCYNATNIITVGGAIPFSVASGASATFIAGSKISFLPGTTAASGSYLHGYISTGTYCYGAVPPMASPVIADVEPVQNVVEQTFFSLYPNPTNGNFTLVQKGETQYGNVKVEVYSMRGDKVLSSQMIGEKKHEFVTSSLSPGLYFVKVVAENYAETIKLIVTR